MPKGIITLSDTTGFSKWKGDMLANLTAAGVDQYVEEDLPVPVGVIGAQDWRQKRGLACAILRPSLHNVWGDLELQGLDVFEKNPYVIWKAVEDAIPGNSDLLQGSLVDEIFDIKRKSYGTMQGYLERFTFLRKRLKEIDLEIPDRVLLWRMVNDLKQHYPIKAEMWSQKLQAKELTFQVLGQNLMRVHHEENPGNDQKGGTDAPTSSRTLVNLDKNGRPKGQGNGRGPKFIQCKRCNRQHTENGVWYDHCSKCHQGGEQRCYVKYPHLRAKDAARQAATNNNSGGSASGSTPAAPAAAPTAANATATGKRIIGRFDNGLTQLNFTMAAADSPVDHDLVALDSCSSQHMFNDLKWFTDMKELPERHKSLGHDGGTLYNSHGGTVKIQAVTDEGLIIITLKDTIYSPQSPCNLISTTKFKEQGAIVNNFNDRVEARSNRKQLGRIYTKYDCQFLEVERPTKVKKSVTDFVMLTVSYRRMHDSLFHASEKVVNKAVTGTDIKLRRQKGDTKCETCMKSKSKEIINRTSIVFTAPGQRIRVDVVTHEPGHLGKKYSIFYIEEYSHYGWVRLKNTKACFNDICEFIEWWEVQTDLKIQTFAVDGGGEFGQGTVAFSNSRLRLHCRKKGIALVPAVAHTPWQNGSIERLAGVVIQMARSAMIHTKLPVKCLPFAIATAIEVRNYLPCEANDDDTSPHEVLWTALNCMEVKPPLEHLRPYGYVV